MSGNSSIEWTDATWSPIRARRADGKWGYHCERISKGCENCYAERMNGRMLPAWGTGLDYTVPNRDKVEIFLDEKELCKPLTWRKPKRIFVESMSDLFGEWVPDEMIDRGLAVAALCPQHTFQILTKRAERLPRYFSAEDLVDRLEVETHERMDQHEELNTYLEPWPLRNVHLGVSVEDRARLGRIEHLRQTPAALRFLSLEPLLEDLGELDLSGIGWVIVGGESGPGARPMHPEWVRSIQRQCAAAGIPFFFKQWGEWAARWDRVGQEAFICRDGHAGPVTKDSIRVNCERHGHRGAVNRIVIRRAGKKKNGRWLDGREYNGMPEVTYA